MTDACLVFVSAVGTLSLYVLPYPPTLIRKYTMSLYVKLDNKKIQQLRLQQCWSQEELATASGISIRTIQRIEKTGNASLESSKALAAVFELTPAQLQQHSNIEHVTFHFLIKYGWIAAFAISSTLFGLWIIDILIPTLKGANFDAQYELHGNFRYLDFGGISFVIGFIWLSINVFVDFQTRKKQLPPSSL